MIVNPIDKKDVNEAIAIPEKIFTDDGRELLIKSWYPNINVNEVISVDLEVIPSINQTPYIPMDETKVKKMKQNSLKDMIRRDKERLRDFLSCCG